MSNSCQGWNPWCQLLDAATSSQLHRVAKLNFLPMEIKTCKFHWVAKKTVLAHGDKNCGWIKFISLWIKNLVDNFIGLKFYLLFYCLATEQPHANFCRLPNPFSCHGDGNVGYMEMTFYDFMEMTFYDFMIYGDDILWFQILTCQKGNPLILVAVKPSDKCVVAPPWSSNF